MNWLLFSLLFFLPVCKKQPQVRPPISDKKLESKLQFLVRGDVSLLGVDSAFSQHPDFLFLDAREKSEYEVSRIPDARWIGYDDFQMDRITALPKDKPVVVYCSVGYRSEIIGRKLRKAGFSKVYNLYGGIFEWSNMGFPIETTTGKPATRIHTYNKDWSQYVHNPNLTKTW